MNKVLAVTGANKEPLARSDSASLQAQKDLLEQSGLGGTLLVVSAVVIYLIEPILKPHGLTAGIFAVLLAIPAAIRCYFYQFHLKREPFQLSNVYHYSVFANALIWGVFGSWVMGIQGNINGGTALVLAVTAAGASAGVISTAMVGWLSRAIVLGYFVPMLMYELFHLREWQILAVSLLTILYVIFLFSLAKKLGKSYWDTHHANQALRDQTQALEEARNVALQANKELEAVKNAAVAATNEAVAASNAKSAFLAHMSHEIRTPLNGVIGMADLLGTSQLDQNQSEQVKTILRSGRLVLGLINNILDFTQISSGRIHLDITSVDVEKLVQTTANIVAPLAQQRKNAVSVVSTLQEQRWIKVDPLRLQQVFTNLLSNANKFTNDGEIAVRLMLKQQRGSPTMLRCEVQDSGMGIDLKSQRNVFDEFVQVNQGESNVRGTGLGLAISKKLIQLMDGQIGVDSVVGHGSCFWFEIPYVPGIPSISLANSVQQERTGMLQQPLLVVEDNLVNQKVISAILTKLTFTHEMVVTGQAAVDYFVQKKPRIILMDCSLPDISGMEATKQIRKIEQEQALPASTIIAVTAHAFADVVQECLEAGMNDHLSKPLTLKSLQASVEKWL